MIHKRTELLLLDRVRDVAKKPTGFKLDGLHVRPFDCRHHTLSKWRA